jgi:hypothetical protein
MFAVLLGYAAPGSFGASPVHCVDRAVLKVLLGTDSLDAVTSGLHGTSMNETAPS